MYILKNAIKSITRNKGRNILIMIIALVIAISACVSLSIREAAETAKEDTISGLTITAQMTFDRTSVMQNMNKDHNEGDPPDRSKFDFDALQGNSLTLDDYMEFTELLAENDGYYYTLSASFNTSGDLLPYGTEESEDESQSNEEFSEQMPFNDKNNMGFQMSSDDFSVTGYSSYNAMLNLFGEDGTHTITDGSVFDETSDELTCIISDELAMYNNLSTGDVITLSNPDNEDEIYNLKIVGIYSNSASDQGNSRFSFSDPANNIYMSSNALASIIDASASVDTETALSAETSFTFVFDNPDNYEVFKSAVEEKGLPENYVLSSADLSAYESSLTPLNTLSSMTGWFFLIVLIIGGIILVVINVFNLRERKYEVGVLTAIGMKKSKVALQFVCELFIITFIAIIIGAGIGATVSVPVTNTLLQQQIEKAEESNTQLNDNFGMQGGNFSGKGDMNFNHGNEAVKPVNYIQSVSSATNLTVILEMVLVGLLLTIISSLAAMVTIMRYEPLRILSDRS